jgi:glycosyltransferase involved in cell wall biosynthesis
LNTDKIRVCVLAEAGLGGTGKAATIYAAELVSRGYEVDYLSAEGPRSAFLKSRGVRPLDPGKSDTDLYNYITRYRPQVIHQHVPGYPTDNRLYRVLRHFYPNERPKVIETNVFGRLEDPEGEDLIDFRLFVSMASAVQAFRRARIKDPCTLLDRHTVLYNPVLPSRDIEPSARSQFREQLRVSDNEILAVRVGRPGHKWSSWECNAYALAKRHAPQVRLLLMEPPQWLTRQVEQGEFGNGIIVHKETSDFEWLETLYAASDVMIHASDWGESFGCTIAEGMAAGLPVITRSTPWGDNAQVELVKHEETGFVCWSVSEMARRLIELSESASLRRKMHAAGKKRIAKLGNVENETDVLEEVIKHLLYDHSLLKVAVRNQKLLEYGRDFRTFETAARKSFPNHPFEFASASIYAAYRSARSDARAIVDRINRRQIGWRPSKRRFRTAVAHCESTVP